jgi:hypothetical protein
MNDFDRLSAHLAEVDPTNDHIFLARFEEGENDNGRDEISVNITDSYHQGTSITLMSDGTWTMQPIGG